MTYNEMITTYICEPLGMKDTCVQVSQQADRAAQGYIVPLRICGLSLVLRPDAWTMADVYQGAVGLRSTVNDLLKYVQAHLQAPNGPLGAQLARVQTPLAETDRSDYKMGMCLMIRQVGWMESPLYWHSGTTGGFSACIAFSKKQQTGVVALANGTLKDGLVEDLLKALVISNNR
jgi:CubicO group peptidase (beta-lactamase class C family)